MVVEGEKAARYQVILLDSLESVPGTLVRADDQDGTVIVRDRIGEMKTFSYGPRRIRILPLRR